MLRTTAERTDPVPLDEQVVPDPVWNLVQPLIPPHPRRRQGGGRSRVDDRRMFSAMAYVLVNDLHWRHLPAGFDITVPTMHRRFQDWTDRGLWAALRLRAAHLAQAMPGEAFRLRRIADAATARTEGPTYRRPAGKPDGPSGEHRGGKRER